MFFKLDVIAGHGAWMHIAVLVELSCSVSRLCMCDWCFSLGQVEYKWSMHEDNHAMTK